MKLRKENTMTVPFDTLAYAKKLEAGGIAVKQAETHAESLAEVLEKSFTPKKDWGQSIVDLDQSVTLLRNDTDFKFNELRTEMGTNFNLVRAEINELRIETNAKFGELRAEMNGKFSEVKSEVIKWVLGISLAQAGLIVSLLKFFH
jgi:hypothetical protein